MRLWLALGLAFLVHLRGKRAFVPVPPPKITNRTFINEYVNLHNKLRSSVYPRASNMLYMTWDLALARTARAWAKKCVFYHNTYDWHPDSRLRPTGENIGMANAVMGPFDSSRVVHAFYDEVNFYNYEYHSCTQECGHYTQVVWSSSYKVGCAVVFCPTVGRRSNIYMFVCNYGEGMVTDALAVIQEPRRVMLQPCSLTAAHMQTKI